MSEDFELKLLQKKLEVSAKHAELLGEEEFLYDDIQDTIPEPNETVSLEALRATRQLRKRVGA